VATPSHAFPRKVSPASSESSEGSASAPATIAQLAPSSRILVVVAITWALWWAQVILIPIVLSVLISYALEPLVMRLESWRLPRAAAVPALLVAILAIGSAGAYELRGEAVAFLDRLPSAAHTIAEAIQGATRGTPGTMAKVQAAARELEAAARKATTKNAQDGVTPVRIEEPTFKWSDWIWQGSHGVLEFAAQMVAVFCLVYYLLLAGDMYKRKLVRIVPTLSDKRLTVEILAEIDRQIERFLYARGIISLVVGVAVWIAYRLLGMEDAGVWAVLSAVLFAAVPLIGPTAVVVGSAIAAFLQFGSIGMVAAVTGVMVTIGALEGNLLTPWLMSRFGEMNAVAVFVSLLFWGWIWGAWGLLLAVPITAVMKAICERIPELNPFAELLKA